MISDHFLSNFSKYWGKRVGENRQLTIKSFWTSPVSPVTGKQKFLNFTFFICQTWWNIRVIFLNGCKKHTRFLKIKKKMEFTLVCMCCLWYFEWFTSKQMYWYWLRVDLYSNNFNKFIIFPFKQFQSPMLAWGKRSATFMCTYTCTCGMGGGG